MRGLRERPAWGGANRPRGTHGGERAAVGLESLTRPFSSRCLVSWLTYLSCRHCQRPIPLLCSRHPEAPAYPRWWPTDRRPVNFLCPACRHVCAYTVSNPQMKPLQVLGRATPSRHQAVFSIGIVCGVEGCASLVTIHALMSATERGATAQGIFSLTSELLAEAIPDAISCEGEDGHLVRRTTLESRARHLDWRVQFLSFVYQTS